jgi:TIR domain-containing protein
MYKYEYDLFISYAHLDNERTDTAEGWITIFHRDLHRMLSNSLGRPATIWRDAQLTPGDDFEAAIMTALKKSAVLVIVMSPTFLERQWFEKEFSVFINAAEERGDLLTGNWSRIFNAMIRATSREKLPDHLQELVAYEFFLQSPEDSGERYYRTLSRLGRDISSLLETLYDGAVTEHSSSADGSQHTT